MHAAEVEAEAEALAWLDARLAAVGRRRTGGVEVVKRRAWGTVMRAETDGGAVWLKLPAPAVAFEVALYPLLHRLVPGRVLAPIAADPVTGRLLLPDGGPTLRDRFQGAELEAAFVRVLPRYAELQRALMPAVPELLAAGVIDMRADVLVRRFDVAVEHAPAVHPKRAWFAAVAAALGESRVPAGLDHADLHEGNVFAGGGLVYDWGDSVIGHPFGSMLVALRLGGDRGRDAYLEVFSDLAPRAELRRDLRNARIAANVIRALTWQRAIGTGAEVDPAFAQGPAVHLRQLLSDAPWECP
ncbi:aminoglycoside phosphotransferase family protein [Dactylosporangium sp. NPDC051541]|uniref:aminoglycoside phosphotransferase family protein n=1 Tax=Dactylosporangium sp. NPDC051541 TaxID=3363977 RepID=UPI0037A2AC93